MDSQTPKPFKVSIQTFGCQMNMYDTEVAEGFLKHSGYQISTFAEDGEASRAPVPDADVVLMNTCSVREHAEERVYGRLGMLGKAKQKNPDMVIGLMGCMVEEHKEKLFKRFPQLDLMVGTRNIKELPALIDEVRAGRRQVAKIKQDGISIEYTDQIHRHGNYHAWLPVMTGCDKVCTFCIVPITRGAEISMPARDVYREAARLVGEGVKWITLLGQNVNSYSGGKSFPELLDMLCEISGLEAVSFTTSHPQDATEELYRVIAKNPKISRRFHLPLQSGSNRILKRMKRLHTYEEYREKIQKMRAMIPEVSVTTDIIAGFSGEAQEDHEETVKALQEIRYDGAYIYKYSVRPGTPAAKLEDDVPHSEKEARNAELLQVQKGIEKDNNEQYLGKTVEVFLETVNPYRPSQVTGRSREEKKVVLENGDPALIGRFHRIRLETLKNETFFGKVVA
jgi:tRNA-2-methylthio-N6-dimethylallyladenosine synthase